MYGVILKLSVDTIQNWESVLTLLCFATRTPVSLQILGSVLGGCCVAQPADQVGKTALGWTSFYTGSPFQWCEAPKNFLSLQNIINLPLADGYKLILISVIILNQGFWVQS